MAGCTNLNPLAQDTDNNIYLCYMAQKVIVSDDRSHNKDSIVIFLRTLLTFIPSEVKELDFWSDGPSNQFKNRYAAVMLKYFEEQMKISIKWNYFATSHGKGPVDGVGAIIKRFVLQKILTRK